MFAGCKREAGAPPASSHLAHRPGPRPGGARGELWLSRSRVRTALAAAAAEPLQDRAGGVERGGGALDGQALSPVPQLLHGAHTLPGARVTVCDRNRGPRGSRPSECERLEGLAARTTREGRGGACVYWVTAPPCT